jgi:hypothetical protein
MKNLIFKIKDIKTLNEIQQVLSKHQSLTENQQTTLTIFLSQLPPDDILLSEKILLDEPFEVKVWNMEKIDLLLRSWKELFQNLPGWNYCPLCYFVENDNVEMLRKNVLMMAFFAPSFSYNCDSSTEPYEVHLKDDGTAIFRLPTLEDAEKYPELYHFKGSWKEAYLLLIATLQKGWPMEEFPEELQKFLPKQ